MLKDCLTVWGELAETGSGVKPVWAFYKFSHGCPACQYSWGMSMLGYNVCDNCPIWTDQGKYEDCRCERDEGSPYKRWMNATYDGGGASEEHKMWASEMVLLIKKAIYKRYQDIA